MSDLCLDEGTIQSYYDGQLAPEVTEQVRTHMASCSTCRVAAQQVQDEMELTSRAFAAEMALNVPSERLRSRIDEAISGLVSQPPVNDVGVSTRLRTWLVSLGSALNLTPQRAFGFASVVTFFVLAAIVGGIVMRQRGTQTGLEVVAETQQTMGELSFNRTVDPGAQPTDEMPGKKSGARRVGTRLNQQKVSGPASENTVDLAHRQLPGERNYLQAISLLTDAIEANGETSLKPTLLADYKRNLEVVNVAIKATQRTARTNPESPDAAEMLFSVYQSKLDLLSAVAEQSRPMIAQR